MKKTKNIFSQCSMLRGCKQVEEPWEIVAWLACLSFWKKNSTSKTNNKKFERQMKKVQASTLEAVRSNDGFKSKNHGKLSLSWPV